MNFNILPNVSFSSLNRINLNYSSNPIAFKGIKEDSFEKSTVQKPSIQEQYNMVAEINTMIDDAEAELKELRTAHLWDKYDKKKDEIALLKQKKNSKLTELNPNIAFLFDSDKSWPERRKILAKRKEIVVGATLDNIDDSCFKNVYYHSPYFIFVKAGGVNFLDTSWDVNKQNYEIMNNKNLASYSQICTKYGFTTQEMNRYVKDGMFKPIHLINLETQEKEAVHIIDLSDEENIKAIERHNQIKNIVLENPYEDKDVISAKKLSELGFGTQQEIAEAVKFHKLPGKIITKETPEGTKTSVLVAYKHPKAVGTLQFLRNQSKTTVNLEQLSKITHADITELEDALLTGEVEYIPYCIYQADERKFLFNLKNPKNLKFINQKLFENEIAKEQIKSEKKEKTSLRSTIAWALCPNTRQAAKSITAQNPKYKEIFEKLDKIKDYDKRESKNELEEGEIRPFLTKDERIKLKTFYKTMWQEAGLEEYKNAMAKAKEAIIQYKEYGLDGVQSEEIKAVIREFYENK